VLEDGVDVDGVWFAAEDLAAGGMAEDADVWVLDGTEDTAGHLVGGLVEVGVDAGYDDVHLGEGGVVEVEGAVGENIDFDAGEDADLSFELLLEFGVDLSDALDVGQGAGVVEAVGHGEVFAVVGDGDVGEAAGEGGFSHLTDGVAAVGGFGVHVEVAANVGKCDEVREGVSCGGFELATVFAELGWNVVEVEGVVDLGFGGGGYDDVVFESEERVLAEGEAALDGALAEGYIVHLAAGEVLEGCSVAGAGEEADVDLEIVAEGEGDFVLAFGDELVDEGKRCDVFDGGADDVGFAGRAGGEEVEVAYGFATAAEGASWDDLVDAGKGANEVDDGIGVLLSLVDAEAAGVFAVVLDTFKQLGDELFAHAGELGEFAGFGGGFKAVDVADLTGGPD